MHLRFSPIDGLLVVLVLIWGSNFSVVKVALDEFPPLVFNALRMMLASGLFMGLLRALRQPTPSREDWPALVGLAVVGHFSYQVCFMQGIARTSVANSSLILGATPAIVALLTLHRGQDRLSVFHWIGIALSFVGIYLVVGRSAEVTAVSFLGDVLMLGAASCWAIYTVGARSLLMRRSPLVVTAWSFSLGTVLFVPLGVPGLFRLEWQAISSWAWGGLVFSAVFALCVAYLIWYTAVQRIGGARTSVYSNMVPVVAMAVAAVWLREPIGALKVLGAATILVGVALTKLRHPPTLSGLTRESR